MRHKWWYPTTPSCSYCLLPQIQLQACFTLVHPSAPHLNRHWKQSPLRKNPRPNTLLCDAPTLRTPYICPSQAPCTMAMDISWRDFRSQFSLHCIYTWIWYIYTSVGLLCHNRLREIILKKLSFFKACQTWWGGSLYYPQTLLVSLCCIIWLYFFDFILALQVTFCRKKWNI